MDAAGAVRVAWGCLPVEGGGTGGEEIGETGALEAGANAVGARGVAAGSWDVVRALSWSMAALALSRTRVS